MAILKLEDTVVRTIGASQVLTDPAALVKELIDNALDAHATSVALEIHNNTLDTIQVRDNGHGIAPEDRSMVAMPNCTSKLVDIDDLKDIGGASLGFRGQALASAAELSGSLTISTRVEGESVATALKINQRGEVVGQERASLPVGTTVRITDFIKVNPVRRQVALKNNEKCLKKIKQTLQAYAFARPYIRFSLRVLKAKNDKGNWMYAPKPGANVEDAAMKIVGSACASQCTWAVVEENGFTLQAFIPSPDAERSKVSNIGSFVSIDARPVTATRGTMKQVIKIFRDHLKATNTAFESVKDPFVHLRISCPTSSYDPNIEPAKDDVLFEDPDLVVAAARRLFEGVYPARQPVTTSVPEHCTTQPARAERPTVTLTLDDEDDFVTSLELPRTNVPQEARLAHVDASEDDQLRTPLLTSDALGTGMGEELLDRPQRTFRSNMYGCDEEDLDFLDARPPTGRTEADFEELRQARKDVKVSNPWVVAKMNATIRQPVTAFGPDQIEELQVDAEIAARRPPLRQRQDSDAFETTGPPTPRASSPSSARQPFHPSAHVPDMQPPRDGRLIGPQTLPPPQLHTPQTMMPHNDYDLDVPDHQPSRQLPTYDYTLAQQAAEPSSGTPLHAIPDTGRPRRSPQKQQARLNRPFVSPVVNESAREKVWFDHLEEDSGPKKQKRPYQPRASAGLVRQGELGDLLDDPRPLTPPGRNRDIRDFVGSVDLAGTGSAASFIEARHYAQASRSRSIGDQLQQSSEAGDENASPTKAVLSSRGFMPASELAAFEARFGSLEKDTARAVPKRRKTGEGRALREITSNVATTAGESDGDEEYRKNTAQTVPQRRKTGEGRALREITGNATTATGDGDDDEEFRPVTANRTASRRRRTTEGSTSKVHRTKSSRLPLERVPVGQGVHNLTVSMPTSFREISHLAGKVDEELSLLDWNEPAIDAYDAFAVMIDAREVQDVAVSLRKLLIDRVSDGEMVLDVGELVRDAFAAHEAEQSSMDVMAMD